MRPLHICRICEQFPPASGGLSPGMLHLSTAQHNQGHKVTVITRATDGDSAHDAQLPFAIVRIGGQRTYQFGWKAYGAYRALSARPHIVHTHGPSAFYYHLRKKSTDAPLVHTLHAVRKYQYALFSELPRMVSTVTNRYGIADYKKKIYYRPYSPYRLKEFFIERQICRHADRLIVVAPFFSDQIQKYYQVPYRKIDVSYNGSNLGVKQNWPNGARRLTHFGVEKQHKVILYVGRTDWVKRIHLLVEAMPLIRAKVPDAKLVVAGTGDQLDVLRILSQSLNVANDVKLLGWVPHNRLSGLYHSASCFCLPSYWEGLSKSLLEAMSVGVPVIGSNNPANREVLEGGNFGWLVDHATPEEWSKMIIWVLNHMPIAKEKAEAATRLLELKYRWHHVAERIYNTYVKAVTAG